MENENYKSVSESYAIIPNKPGAIQFCNDDTWVMSINEGRITFNREEFPDICADEFAYKILEILEKINLIKFDKSQWDNGRIKVE